MENFLHGAFTWIELHPDLSLLSLFVISLLESLVVVGLLIPGAVMLFGIGALLTTGVLPVMPTILWASAGAVAGDTISYVLGHHYHQRLRVIWPLKRYPALVNRGVDFFFRHGGKSVFMARFIGPLRPIVPAIAGMMDMRVGRFLLVDVIASLLWAPAYIFPGMVFGASLELAAEVAGRLVVLLLVILAIGWFVFILMHNIARLLQPRAAVLLRTTLEWSRTHPLIRPLAGSLLDPNHPETRGLAILSVLFFITAWLLLWISQQVLHGTLFSAIDHNLFSLLGNLRTPFADRVMVFVTLLGERVFLAAVLVSGCLWLFWKRYTKAAIHWLAAYACAGIMTWVFKVTEKIARPVDFYGGYSFPSAHTSMSLVVYGFLALMIARELPFRQRWLPYSVAGILVTSIGLSRLYLGVHWFSDVLGGLSLGLLWVALIGIAYDRHPAPILPVRKLLTVMGGTLLVFAALQAELRFKDDLAHFAPRFEVREMHVTDWQATGWQQFSAYHADLEGVKGQPLNIQWAGSLPHLQAVLQELGWHEASTRLSASILNWVAPEPEITGLPILPQVHDGRYQKLLMINPVWADRERLVVLRLWPANATLSPGGEKLWVGKASYLEVNHSLPLISFLKTAPEFDTPLAVLREGLAQRVHTRVVQRPGHIGSSAQQGVTWNGEVLLAWE